MQNISNKQILFKIINLCFVVFLLILNGCSPIRTLDTTGLKPIDISGDKQAMAELEMLSKDQILAEPKIFKIPAGFQLPLNIAIETPVAGLNSTNESLTFYRDLYVYVSREQMLVSPDGNRWADFTDLETVKELFNGDKGEMSIGLSASKEDGAVLQFHLKLYEKQE